MIFFEMAITYSFAMIFGRAGLNQKAVSPPSAHPCGRLLPIDYFAVFLTQPILEVNLECLLHQCFQNQKIGSPMKLSNINNERGISPTTRLPGCFSMNSMTIFIPPFVPPFSPSPAGRLLNVTTKAPVISFASGFELLFIRIPQIIY